MNPTNILSAVLSSRAVTTWAALISSFWLVIALGVEPELAKPKAPAGCTLPLNACAIITPAIDAQQSPVSLRDDADLDRAESVPTTESDVFSTQYPVYAVPASASEVRAWERPLR